jgi:wyosine [tRNA(Phe)-imidazoG37] synthetase (radical SAM superfamily)
MFAFGPVPSRRLGRSLGINNIPPKACTYSCIYCQLGRTRQMRTERRAFLDPQDILREVQSKIDRALELGERVDYLSFVPDGEPTLDVNLGRAIELLRPLGIPIAVITNSSLLWRQDVRADLMAADWVSLKVDSVCQVPWRSINRPHGHLQLPSILEGALQFAASFGGDLTTETMLAQGVNDGADHIQEVGNFLALLQPSTAYLSVPTRPPAERWVRAPSEQVINQAYHILRQSADRVECLLGYEGNAFAYSGDVQADLLSITAVHPMREDAVQHLLARAGADWSVVEQLLAQGQLARAEYGGGQFYLRSLQNIGRPTADDEEGTQ